MKLYDYEIAKYLTYNYEDLKDLDQADLIIELYDELKANGNLGFATIVDFAEAAKILLHFVDYSYGVLRFSMEVPIHKFYGSLNEYL